MLHCQAAAVARGRPGPHTQHTLGQWAPGRVGGVQHEEGRGPGKSSFFGVHALNHDVGFNRSMCYNAKTTHSVSLEFGWL